MNILLIHPEFPITYWGYQHALSIIGTKATLPPLGLITLAALLPEHCEPTLIDMNVRKLRDRHIRRADAVLVGGMHIQGDSMLEVVRRAKAMGKPVAVGGPGPTTDPERYREADVIFGGEAEGRIPELFASLLGDGPQYLPAPEDLPDLADSPIPRFDLLEPKRYTTMSLQYSRGCPYTCEFCDIIEIFGRKPRVKPDDQVFAELTAIADLGWRGPVFFVDDNFIGHKPAVKRLLPLLIEQQNRAGRPFNFFTEASVNLAKDTTLVADMVKAGFTAVFLGIESPSPEALKSAGKTQNLRVDLVEAVNDLTRAGLEVMGGFIVGFDTDTADVFEHQERFLEEAAVPRAMIGLLTALPGTALWRRLESEGRLRRDASGDQFDRPNFEPALDEAVLLRGYRDLMARTYDPERYYARVHHHVSLLGKGPNSERRRSLSDLRILARVLWRIGVLSPRRALFRRLLLHTLRHAPHGIPTAITLSILGEHFIRYTRDELLPLMDRALAELEREGAEIDMKEGRSRPAALRGLQEASAPPPSAA